MRFSAVPLVLVLAAGAAFAQPVAPVAGAAAEPAPTVVYAKRTALVFTDALLEGDRDGPDGVVVWLRPKARFRNLIELRAHFRPELARSASRLPATAP